MTAYCTQADLELEIRASELVQLTNDGTGTTVDATILGRAIARAGSRINAVAGAHYAVPFSPVPDYIRDLAVDLTLVKLAERRSKAPGWAESKGKRVARALDRLAKGHITVGSQPEPPRNPERLPVRYGDDALFTTQGPDPSLQGF